MPKRRVSNLERSSRTGGKSNQSELAIHRFAGVSLSGGKNPKTIVSVLDYYIDHQRLVLSKLIDFSKEEAESSMDEGLLLSLKSLGQPLRSVAFDVPLSFPHCSVCQLKCPGIRNCREPHIEWMWDNYGKLKRKKKTTRLFTPYTQRPVEAYIHSQLEETFYPSDALGANMAPLTARMAYLLKHLTFTECVETFPRLSIWRIGRALHIERKHLIFQKHSEEAELGRLLLLTSLADKNLLFFYQADMAKLVNNGSAFDSLISAFTAFLKYKSLTEARPQGFPPREAWIEIPHIELSF